MGSAVFENGVPKPKRSTKQMHQCFFFSFCRFNKGCFLYIFHLQTAVGYALFYLCIDLQCLFYALGALCQLKFSLYLCLSLQEFIYSTEYLHIHQYISLTKPVPFDLHFRIIQNNLSLLLNGGITLDDMLSNSDDVKLRTNKVVQ